MRSREPVARRNIVAATISLKVVDLYHGERVTSFQKADDFGICGIIHKATTGATEKDKKYSDRRAPAIQAGLLWGAYHWGTGVNVAKQVDNFLTTAKPDDQTLVALDFEDKRMTLSQGGGVIDRIGAKFG